MAGSAHGDRHRGAVDPDLQWLFDREGVRSGARATAVVARHRPSFSDPAHALHLPMRLWTTRDAISQSSPGLPDASSDRARPTTARRGFRTTATGPGNSFGRGPPPGPARRMDSFAHGSDRPRATVDRARS